MQPVLSLCNTVDVADDLPALISLGLVARCCPADRQGGALVR